MLTVLLVMVASFNVNASLIEESYVGTFDNDNARIYVSFDITQDNSIIEFLSLGYAGGVNSQGEVIADGGFDTMFWLFDSANNQIADNDDGRGVSSVSTGWAYDALISTSLNTGSYVLAMTQFDNFLMSGDVFTGNWSTAGFLGVDGRTNNYAFDFSGQNVANIVVSGLDFTPSVTSVPEPTTVALLGLSVFGFAARKRSKK